MNSVEIHNKILSGDIATRIKEGLKVIGPNTSNGDITSWHFDSEQMAMEFARHNATTTGNCYEVIEFKFVAVVRPVKPINYQIEIVS